MEKAERKELGIKWKLQERNTERNFRNQKKKELIHQYRDRNLKKYMNHIEMNMMYYQYISMTKRFCTSTLIYIVLATLYQVQMALFIL